jgi:uncharacterized membrane protein
MNDPTRAQVVRSYLALGVMLLSLITFGAALGYVVGYARGGGYD